MNELSRWSPRQIKEDEHFYLLKITKNTNDFASTENEYFLKNTYYKVYLLF